MAKRQQKNGQYIAWFKDIKKNDDFLVGKQHADFGRLHKSVSKKEMNLLDGFALTTTAYWEFLKTHNIDKKIKGMLKEVDIRNVVELKKIGKNIRNLILEKDLPNNVQKALIKSYKKLHKRYGAVMIRPSVASKNTPKESFAGQQDSFLNITTEKALLHAVKRCIASLFSDRALVYREKKGYDHMTVGLSVGIQQMIDASNGANGMISTLDTELGMNGVMLINATYGLGEYGVTGNMVSDQFHIFKEGVKKGKEAIIRKNITKKDTKRICGKNVGTKKAVVPKTKQEKSSINNGDIITLAKWGMRIEEICKIPQHIAWVKDGKTGTLYIVQSSSKTVDIKEKRSNLETYLLKKTGKKILDGTTIGQKIGAGKVCVLDSLEDLKKFKAKDVLVTKTTTREWEPLMRIASAIIVEEEGKTSHAALVGRRLGIPTIVGVKNARKTLKKYKKITVSGGLGEKSGVFEGFLPYEVKKTLIQDIPKTQTKIMINVGDPTDTFNLSDLPHDGVGLIKMESILASEVKVHPLALSNYLTLKNKKIKKQIQEITKGYSKKNQYGVDKLAEGIAKVAAATYPKEVTIQLSDQSASEYKKLLGGELFEDKKKETGASFCGVSRYYNKKYTPAFKLECDAIKKVREQWGLHNVMLMVPFCRTPEEGKKVLKQMEKYGVKRGDHGLKVTVMCEIPSNAVLAGDFAKLFDGFSIGIDTKMREIVGEARSKKSLAEFYNTKNKIVRGLVKDIIDVAHKHKRKVSICGEASSEYPEFTNFLVQSGIDSVSLNPSALIATKKRIASVEKRNVKKGETNKRYLSIVAGFALMAASLIGVGAGCGSSYVVPTPIEEVSPAQIPQQLDGSLEERITALEEEVQEKKNIYSSEEFFGITFSYPQSWTQVEHKKGNVIIKNPQKEIFEGVDVFIKETLRGKEGTTLIIGEYNAVLFRVEKEGITYEGIEIQIDDNILEIQTIPSEFEEIIASIEFKDVGIR